MLNLNHAFRWGVALTLLTCLSTAQAGRPLTVDDASVNTPGTCQLEAWIDRTAYQNTAMPGAACGVLPGLEVGLGINAPQHTRRTDSARGVGLKYVPEWATWENWALGGKLSLGSTRPAGERRWTDDPVSVSALASRPFNDEWTLHVNAGVDVVRRPSQRLATAGLALAWTPQARWLLFAELFGAEKTAATRGVGVRYWVLPEVLGVDATAQRSHTGGGTNTYTVGIGWYGLGL